MAKRGAQSTLDHLNWNETDAPEEVGEFAKASDDVLKQRVIKKARRRVAGDADSTAAATSTVFGGFKGFQSTPLAKSDEKPDGAKSFSFLATLGSNGNGAAAAGSSVSSSGAVASESVAAPMFSFGSNAGTTTAKEGIKTFSFGSPNTLKADSTDSGVKPLTGFGISSSKDNGSDTNKNFFSLGTNSAKPSSTFGDVNAKTFSFGSNTSKPASSSEPPVEKKTFTFGLTGKEAFSGAPKSTISFGSLAAKSDTTGTDAKEAEKDAVTSPTSTFTFGKPISPSDTSTGASTVKSTFSFGSVAPKSDIFSFAKLPAKSDSLDASSPKSTFSFGSIPLKKDSTESGTTNTAAKETASTTAPKSTFSFGSPAAKTSDSIGKSTFSFGSINPSKTEAEAGPGADKETSTGTLKSTFSFGTLTAKSDSSAIKSTFSFGSLPSKSDSAEAATAKVATSDVTKPSSSSSSSSGETSSSQADDKPTTSGETKITFGFPGAKQNVIAAEKKSFTFGVPPASKESAAIVDKKAFSFGPAKGDAKDTIKSMFNFATSGAKPNEPEKITAKKVAPNKDSEGAAKRTPSFGIGSSVTAKDSNKVPSSAVSSAKRTEEQISAGKATFQADVIKLNKTFTEWISSNVKNNPFCQLHIVFRDYERYFAQLEAERAAATGISSLCSSPTPAETKKDITTIPAKEPEKEKSQKQAEKVKPTFSFGVPAKDTLSKTTTPVATTTQGITFGAAKPFSFGSSSSTTGGIGSSTLGGTIGKSSGPLSFGTSLSSTSVPTTSPSFFAGASTFGSKPATAGGLFGTAGLTFGNVTKPATDGVTTEKDGGTAEEADEDEPPKVEFTPVEEKDSLYSKRCKLFVKAGGAFSDRGIGTLHIKKVDSKVQVLVRAETSLGNILLNIILNESVPLQRMGKNNVMMVCLPTPESKPPPTSVLLRVKTAEEADELHETLLKYKPK